jgi:hypothetical protein
LISSVQQTKANRNLNKETDMTYDDSYVEFFQRMAQQRAREEDGGEIEDDADEHVPFYDDSYVEFFQRME